MIDNSRADAAFAALLQGDKTAAAKLIKPVKPKYKANSKGLFRYKDDETTPSKPITTSEAITTSDPSRQQVITCRRWSDDERSIIKNSFNEGKSDDDIKAALAVAGYERTEKAITQKRFKTNLIIRRRWSDDERSIVKNYYLAGKSDDDIKTALAEAGYERTDIAIKLQRHLNSLTRKRGGYNGKGLLWTPEKKQAFSRLLSLGLTDTQISRHFSTCRNSISHIRRKYNLGPINKHKNQLSASELEQAMIKFNETI